MQYEFFNVFSTILADQSTDYAVLNLSRQRHKTAQSALWSAKMVKNLFSITRIWAGISFNTAEWSARPFHEISPNPIFCLISFKVDEGQYKKHTHHRMPPVWGTKPSSFYLLMAFVDLKRTLKPGSAMAHNPRKRTHLSDVKVEDILFKNLFHDKYRGLQDGFESLSFESWIKWRLEIVMRFKPDCYGTS